MIKRIIAAVLVFMCICSTAIYAGAAEVSDSKGNANLNEDILTVSGSAPADTYVTLMVLYPNYSKDNLTVNNYTDLTKAVAFADGVLAKADGYSFTVPLIDRKLDTNGGGTFKFIITEGDKETVIDYEFYFYDKKLEVIGKVNNPADVSEAALLADAIKTFSYSKNALWTGGDSTYVLTAFKNIKNAQAGGTFALDPAQFSARLKEALVIGAVNAGKNSLVTSGGYLTDDVLAYADEQTLYDYNNSLSDSGKALFTQDVIKGSYTTPAVLTAELRKLMAFHAIKNYKQSGYGHIDGFIDRYADVYTGAGFETAEYNLITDESLLSKFMLYFKALTYDNLEQMALAFNQSLDEYNAPSDDGDDDYYYGGGGGISFGGGSVSSDVVDKNKEEDATENTPSAGTSAQTPFKDMEDASWAIEHVALLYKEGIISGRSADSFGPAEKINRAEFAKLAVKIKEKFGGDIAVTNENAFTDVTAEDWYLDTVLKASEAGLINGADGKFMPKDNITREDAAVIVYRLIGDMLTENGELSFTDDAQISDYAKDAIKKLADAGIINGMGDGTFAPKQNLTRAQAASLMGAVYTLLNK